MLCFQDLECNTLHLKALIQSKELWGFLDYLGLSLFHFFEELLLSQFSAFWTFVIDFLSTQIETEPNREGTRI
jgi:hypothetical protein